MEISNWETLFKEIGILKQQNSNIESKLDFNINRLDENIYKLSEYVEGRLNNAIRKIEENEKTLFTVMGFITVLEKSLMHPETKYIREQLLSDHYSKRNNLIIYGLTEQDQIEDRMKSLQLVKNFLKVQLKIDQDISIVDAHRLRSSKSNEDRIFTRSTTKSKTLIFKLSNIFDKDLIMKNLKNLKPDDPSIKQKNICKSTSTCCYGQTKSHSLWKV